MSAVHGHARRLTRSSRRAAGAEAPEPGRLELADIVRAHAADYLASRGGDVPACQRRLLQELAACRTAALGGHAARCDHCGAWDIAYNSCRNRHCPKCSGAVRARWLDRCRLDLLPVPYFQVVFTLPAEFSRLALAHRRLVYDLLFQAAAATLLEVASDPRHLGAKIGVMLVLHTWGQNLEHHPHVHGVVPAGGLSPDRLRWVACRKRYFLPVQVLSRVFRGKFLAGLTRLLCEGGLRWEGVLAPLADPRVRTAWLSTLYAKEWVVYVEPPPDASGDNPEPVLKYLARYVGGVAISNRRLLSLIGGQVTFRWKNYRSGGQSQTMTLPAVEFLRRYLQHLLPSRFVRIRYYGFLSTRQRRTDLACCRRLLATGPASAEPATLPIPSVPAEPEPAAEPRRCRNCGVALLQPVCHWPRPTLPQLMGVRLWHEPSHSRPRLAGSEREAPS